MKLLGFYTAFFLAATAVASASTIGFIGTATTVNDGSDYVLPYQVTIDGVSQLVTCIDLLDTVNYGDIWQAGLLTLPVAAESGFFTGTDLLPEYERVAWLSVQTYSNDAQQVGLQHAIWNVFATTFDTAESMSYEAAANVEAASNYAGFDFSSFRVIQQAGAVAGALGTEQEFIYQVAGPIADTSQVALAPEPGTVSLFGLGTVAIGLVARRRLPRFQA